MTFEPYSIDISNGYIALLTIGSDNSWQMRSFFFFQWKYKIHLHLFFIKIIK